MAKVPASIRYKNPGAMWGSPLAKKWGSTKTVALKDGTGQGNNIAVFDTWVQGICAQLDLWRTSKHYRNKQFKDAIKIWSGGNHVEAYIKFVLDRIPGMTRNTVMDDAFWRSEMGIAFLKAQAWHEAGRRYPAPEADWIEAQRRVFAGAVPTKKKAPKPPAIDDTSVVSVDGTTNTKSNEIEASATRDTEHSGSWLRRKWKGLTAWFSGVGGVGVLGYFTDPWVIVAIGGLCLVLILLLMFVAGPGWVRAWMRKQVS